MGRLQSYGDLVECICPLNTGSFTQDIRRGQLIEEIIYIPIIPKEGTMDEWAKAWLRREREKGVKCLEIKYISGNPYVYHSTSRYDRTTKSPRKVSTYLGRLTEEEGLIPKGAKKRGDKEPVTWIVEPPAMPGPEEAGLVEDTGDTAPIPEETRGLIPQLLEVFSDHVEDFSALIIPRIGLESPLTGSGSNTLPNSPDPPSQALLRALTLIGSNESFQQKIFSDLSTGARRIAYPFALAGTGSDSSVIHAALLIIEADSGIPIMVQRLPEPPCDLSMIARSLLSLALPEKGPGEAILFINSEEMMQMGSYGSAACEYDLAPLLETGMPFLYPLPKESSRYDTPLYLTDHFTRGDHLILSGSEESGSLVTYLFKDVRSAGEETEVINSAAETGLIDRATLRSQLRRAGRRLILSSMRVESEEIFDLALLMDRIHPSVVMIRELVEMDLAMAGNGEMDADAITGSLFLSLLTANLSQTSKVGGGETGTRTDAPGRS
jgi:hypothetical protein